MFTLDHACRFKKCPSKGAPIQLVDCSVTELAYKFPSNKPPMLILRGTHVACGHVVTTFVSKETAEAVRRALASQVPESEQSESEIQPLI
jgi:hypothetical protein